MFGKRNLLAAALATALTVTSGSATFAAAPGVDCVTAPSHAAPPVDPPGHTASRLAAPCSPGLIPQVEPMAAPKGSAPASTAATGVSYYYAGIGHQRPGATSMSAALSQHRPVLGDDWHTLAELAMIDNGSAGRNIVEVGWTVSTRGLDVFRVDDPALTDFVRLPHLNPQMQEPLS